MCSRECFEKPPIKKIWTFPVLSCTFQEILPVIVPMYHAYGMVTVLLNGMCSGSKLITIPKYTPEWFIRVLEAQNPTVAYLAPPTVFFMLNDNKVRPEHMSPLKAIVSGAAPLGASDIENLLIKSRGRTTFLQSYGLTEASPDTHLQTPFTENGIEIGGTGLTLPNTESLIIATDKKERVSLGPNSVGELLIRGPQTMKGYHKNADSTRTVLDAEGWLRTGDLAYFNKNGHLFVTDRLKELIKVRGFQVAPAELEAILRNHPNIVDAGVVGVPHDKYGEVPKAFVVPKPNTKLTTDDVKNFVSAKVAAFKQLQGGVVFVEGIPKSNSGKIMRRILRSM